MSKEANQQSPEFLKKYKERLIKGVEKASQVYDASIDILHADTSIDTDTLPFSLLPQYDFSGKETEDEKIDSLLRISDVTEQVAERTLPVLQEKITLVSAEIYAHELEQKIQQSSERIERMREKVQKGIFPAKTLQEAEIKMIQLQNDYHEATVQLLELRVSSHRSRLARMTEGRGRGLYTDETVFFQELQLEESEGQLKQHTDDVLENDEASLQNNTQISTIDDQTNEVSEVNEQVPELSDSEIAEDFYASFIHLSGVSPQSEAFYSFLRNAVSTQSGTFHLQDLSQALYANVGYISKTSEYMTRQDERMYYLGWEIIPINEKDGLYKVRRIDDSLATSEKTDQQSQQLSTETSISDEEQPGKKKYHEQDINPTRYNALVHMALTPDWTVQEIVSLLGPARNGRKLSWNQASTAVTKALDRLYSRIKYETASDEEREIWKLLAEDFQEDGKDSLLALREHLKAEFLTRKNTPETQTIKNTDVLPEENALSELPEDTPVNNKEISQPEAIREIPVLSEDEIGMMGALITTLNKATIVLGNKKSQFLVDRELVGQYAYHRKNLRRRFPADQLGIAALQQLTLEKVKEIISEENPERLNEIVSSQREDAFLLLYSVIENNELFGGEFINFVTSADLKIWSLDGKDYVWEAPHTIPLMEDENTEVIIESEQQVVNGDDISPENSPTQKPKVRRIEKTIPDVRLVVQEIVKTTLEMPEKMNIRQIKSINYRLGQIANYAVEHNYCPYIDRGSYFELARRELVLINFLYQHREILQQPRLVKELSEIIDEELL